MDTRDIEKEAALEAGAETAPSIALGDEKGATAPPAAGRESENTTGYEDGATAGFEPIRSPMGGERQARPRTAPGRSIARMRSNNGYGCDAKVDDEDEDDHGSGSGQSSSTETGATERRRRAEADPYEVGWDGGDADPNCPRSMSFVRKWLIVFITSFGSFCVTCASSIYTSSYTKMNAEFGNSSLVATLGLSLFVLGISIGPAWSPLSEFYGRRPVYLLSFALFLIWIVPSAVAQNIETMIVARFFQGFTGSAFLSVSGGTVGDLFSKGDISLPVAVFTLATFVGPSMGPLFGGFINAHADWRWTHYVLLIWSLALLAAIALLVPETYHPVLLRDKARRIRAATGDGRWRAPIEKSAAAGTSIPATVARSLLRPFQLLASEPICLALDLYSAILLGILYLFFGAFPLVFGRNHGFDVWQVGLTFLGMLVGMVLAIFTNPVWYGVYGRLAARYEAETGVKGATEPEFHLPCVIAGGLLIPVGLFWFGWTTYSSVHWIVPIIGSGVFGAGTILVFKGIFTYLVDAYPMYSASALAANVFVRCAFAAAFPLFGIQMYEKLGYQWATTLLAFLTVAMLPFPFIFFYYGKKIRGKSRYAAA